LIKPVAGETAGMTPYSLTGGAVAGAVHILGALLVVIVLVVVVLGPRGLFGGDKVDKLDATEKRSQHWTS
jgi:hypothetical protein